MPRFSISRTMAVIALVAANCAALRAVLPQPGGSEVYFMLMFGLLPLLDAQIIALYLTSTRYQISVRRRTELNPVGFAPAFAIANAPALLALLTAGVMVPDTVMAHLQYVLWPVAIFFHSLGFQQADYQNAVIRFAVPLLFGAALTGPPLVFAFTVSWVWNRYQLVIAARLHPWQ
jgi:hypothetical protein